MRQSFLVRGSYGFTPMQLAIVLGTALLVGGLLVGGDRMPQPPVIPTAIVCGVLMVHLLSYVGASARGIDDDQYLSADRALLSQTVMALAFLLLVTVIRTRQGVIWILRGLLVGGALSAGYALLQTAVGLDIAPFMRIPVILKNDTATLVSDLMRAGAVRPQGAAGHPLELSAVLTTLTPVALGVSLEAKARGTRWWPWAILGGIIAAGALVTVSRSALVGMFLTATIFALVSPLRRTLWTAGIATVIVLAAAAAQLRVFNQLAEVLAVGSQDNSLESRSFGAKYVRAHFDDHLWLGGGPGSYDLTRQPVLDNEYLSRLMEIGVIGVGAFCLYLGLGVTAASVAAIRALRARDRGLTDLSAGVAAAIATIVVTASILDISGFAQVSMLLTLLVALSVVLMRGTAGAHSPLSQTSEGTNP